MRITLLSIMLLPLFAFSAEGMKKRCGHSERINYLKSVDPGFEQRILADEQFVQNSIHRNALSRASNVVYTIPVVVHVIYRTNAENISNAQIQAQIDVLNQDFGRKNTDTVNTPLAFRSVSSATSFQFCLAQQDPGGNLTNGIERRLTTVTSFDLDDKMKSYSTGGLDAWDVNRYMNIWVCNLTGGILGYGDLPSLTHSNNFGVVVHYDAFGKGGVATPPYHLGRTCTHEISHCFRLVHIWGDDNNNCNGTDYVADTPNQQDATFGCSSFPRTDACSNASPGIMYMNYMDYTDDACMNMFTIDQAARMLASVNAFYPTLLSSNGCQDVTGIDERARYVDMSIYPNPTDGWVTIDLMNAYNFTGGLNVSVFDAIGKLQRSTVIASPNGSLSKIDLSDFDNGIYFITIYNDDFSRTVRITLNR